MQFWWILGLIGVMAAAMLAAFRWKEWL